ncbi:MAG: helix-turn-helix transcriptional regulator [Dehalococcoidia bacterium]
MSVAVYPRLSELLRAKRLSVAELERRIEARYGLQVDPKTLYRLTAAAPVQRADLEVAGAAAAILGVGLGDLFDVHAVPLDDNQTLNGAELDSAQSHRLADLFDRQARGALSPAEQDELESLVSAYGRRLHERRLRELAHQRGVALDEVRREAATRFDDALSWWDGFQGRPAARASVAAGARRRRGQKNA